jgi:hypothetical protein
VAGSCQTHWTGPNCEDCVKGQYGAECRSQCNCNQKNTKTCDDGRGGDGKCTCNPGYAGADCSDCDGDKFGANCAACTCVHGECDSGVKGTGTCVPKSCEKQWAGDNCDECKTNFYGKSCRKCTCKNGVCDDGVAGDGHCKAGSCNSPSIFGANCDKPCACKHGTCSNNTAGTGHCVPGSCEVGFGGPNCDQPVAPPTPVGPLPPDPSGLKKCPNKCKAAFTKCLQGYPHETCVDYAANGLLCPMKCSAVDFLDRNPSCPGNQVFTACLSGCTATCIDPQACKGSTKPTTCHSGCECPAATPIWDPARRVCVTEAKCAPAGECPSVVNVNYLGMGNARSTCNASAYGDTCHPSCFSDICAPRPSYLNQEELTKECGALSQSLCGLPKAQSNIDYSHKCLWSGKAGKAKPELVCSGGAWLPTTVDGSCGNGASQLKSACSVLANTQCVTEQGCSANQSSSCAAIATGISTKCRFPCLNANSNDKAALDKCSVCVLTQLLAADAPGVSPPKNVPDLFPCCGCLSGTELGKKMTFNTPAALEKMLTSPCQAHSVLDDDDKMDDDLVGEEVATGSWFW